MVVIDRTGAYLWHCLGMRGDRRRGVPVHAGHKGRYCGSLRLHDRRSLRRRGLEIEDTATAATLETPQCAV